MLSGHCSACPHREQTAYYNSNSCLAWFADYDHFTPRAESVHSNGIFEGNSVIGLEDLYVWANPRSSGRPGCHMVLHQEEAGIENLGAHAFTEDPTCIAGWQLTEPRPSHAYGPELTWTNGSVTKFGSRERPQVVLDADSGFPTHLSNGFIPGGWSGRSFTLVAPIDH